MDTLIYFNFSQAVQKATHSKGQRSIIHHYSLSPDHLTTKSRVLARKAVLFNAILSHSGVIPDFPICHHVFHFVCQSVFWLFYSCFLAAFNLNLNTEELVSFFNQTSHTILDLVALYKLKKTSRTPRPWLNQTTNELKGDCRRKEWKRNKTGLAVFCESNRDINDFLGSFESFSLLFYIIL